MRVTFNYDVDYYFALTQTAINLQQNVSLPNGVTPQIQATSLVGEIYRYQLARSAALRLDQSAYRPGLDRATPPAHGAGGRAGQYLGRHSKEYDVDVDLHKLEAYNVTLPQVITALGNANVNVGGRASISASSR